VQKTFYSKQTDKLLPQFKQTLANMMHHFFVRGVISHVTGWQAATNQRIGAKCIVLMPSVATQDLGNQNRAANKITKMTDIIVGAFSEGIINIREYVQESGTPKHHGTCGRPDPERVTEAYGSDRAILIGSMEIRMNAADYLSGGIYLVLIRAGERHREIRKVNVHVLRDKVRQQKIIRVQKGDKRAIRVLNARSKSGKLPTCFGMNYQLKCNGRLRTVDEVPNPADGIILRTIIDNDAFKRRIILHGDGLEGLADILRIIIVRQDNRDFRGSDIDILHPRIQRLQI
jgi:hypothetical protein